MADETHTGSNSRRQSSTENVDVLAASFARGLDDHEKIGVFEGGDSVQALQRTGGDTAGYRGPISAPIVEAASIANWAAALSRHSPIVLSGSPGHRHNCSHGALRPEDESGGRFD
jgi:hypothetical protein